MSDPFLAEIKIVGFNFAPRGYAFCDGQILPINQNQSLFSLLGTTYGGDGRTSFALPDLRGRTPTHPGGNDRLTQLGAKAGAETVTLSTAEMPAHRHPMRAEAAAANIDLPTGNSLAHYGGGYGPAGVQPVTQPANTIGGAGGGQAHDNMQPFTTLGFVIALQGVFPSRD